MITVVTGANGNIGAPAVTGLVTAGHAVRGVVRSPASAAALREQGVEPVVADIVESVPDDVFVGADRALLISPVGEQMTDVGIRLVDAAIAAGVSRLVRVSIDTAFIDAGAILGVAHDAVDRHLAASDVRHTILRPPGFMQNLLAMAPTIQEGAIVAPTGEGRVPFIDARDIAACAVAVLDDNTDVDGPVDVTGPDSLTFAEIAARLTARLDHEVVHISPSGTEARAGLAAAGFDGWLLDAMLDDTHQVSSGIGADVRDGVQRLTGASPNDIDSFLDGHLNTFRAPRSEHPR